MSGPGIPVPHQGGEDVNGADDLLALFEQIKADVTAGLEVVGWAEDEIRKAQLAWPDQADRLYHAFSSAIFPAPGINLPVNVEFVWRGHFAGMLATVAAGGDTRGPSYAELCMICSHASERVPLSTGGTLLYMRSWVKAFPDNPAFPGLDPEAYAHIGTYDADQLEQAIRTRFTNANKSRRIARDLACPGLHWGEPAPGCRYAGKTPGEPGTALGISRKRTTARKKGPAARARTQAASLTSPPDGVDDVTLTAEVASLLSRVKKTPAD